MEKLNILIVEDETIIAEALMEMCEEIGNYTCDIANNFSEAIQKLSSNTYELALLDINLSDRSGSGIDVAQHINTHNNIPFIFITAYSDNQNFQAAKNLNPCGYVLKPINKDRLYIAIELALENSRNRNSSAEKLSEQAQELQGLFPDSFFVKEGINYQKVNFTDVLFLKSDGNYTEIKTEEKTYLIRSLLKDIDRKLPSTMFKRVHRSYIVNFPKITTYAGIELTIGTHKIPVSESFRKDIQQILEMKSL